MRGCVRSQVHGRERRGAMGTQTPRVGMRPFTAVLLRATLVALLVATGIGPSAPLRAQTPADRTNHIRNSSVETDTKGWNKYTNDDTLKVDYSRDTQLGFDGTASLRQDIAISDDMAKTPPPRGSTRSGSTPNGGENRCRPRWRRGQATRHWSRRSLSSSGNPTS